MYKNKKTISSFVLLLMIIITSAYTVSYPNSQKKEVELICKNKQNQTINLFVTHGHCSLPFAGVVEDLEISAPKRYDLGNPLENMEISFEINPHTFNVCSGDDLTARIKTPGLFIGENNENMTFRSMSVYTIGVDWYQVNGEMSIKGVEKDVKLFVTGIRDPKDSMPSSLVIESQMNLFDWGIDYDKIVNGESENISTKWMYINMKIETS